MLAAGGGGDARPMAAEEGAGAAQSPRLSDERVSLQTHFGTVELAFFPDVAPQHYRHVLKVFQMGLYNTNHFFRVDKGFVSQIADVVGGRHPDIPMSFEQRLLAKKNIPAEFSNIPHKAGILSMARYSDPDLRTTSFSILLGDAPHLVRRGGGAGAGGAGRGTDGPETRGDTRTGSTRCSGRSPRGSRWSSRSRASRRPSRASS